MDYVCCSVFICQLPAVSHLLFFPFLVAVLKKKVQTVTSGEFNRKSIKERAVLLRSMFPESETPLVKEYKVKV